jgi:hypothetical protein
VKPLMTLSTLLFCGGTSALTWAPCGRYVPLLQHLASGIAPSFDALTASLLEDVSAFLPGLEDAEATPLRLGFGTSARPGSLDSFGCLQPPPASSERTSQVTTPRSVSLSSLSLDDWPSEALAELTGEQEAKPCTCASKSAAVQPMRSMLHHHLENYGIRLGFKNPQLEQAFCYFRNEQAVTVSVSDSFLGK